VVGGGFSFFKNKENKGAEPPFLYTLLLNLSSNWLYMAISSELVKVTLKKFKTTNSKVKLFRVRILF
jgi:hypothetical protein